MSEGLQIGGFDVYERTLPFTRDVETHDGRVLGMDELCYDVHLIASIYTDFPEIKQNLRFAWKRSLEELAHYAYLRKDQYAAEIVVGTTYKKMGRLAVRGYGFDAVPANECDALVQERLDILATHYKAEPMVVWTTVDTLIDRYWLGWSTEHVESLAEAQNNP